MVKTGYRARYEQAMKPAAKHDLSASASLRYDYVAMNKLDIISRSSMMISDMREPCIRKRLSLLSDSVVETV